MRRGTRVAQGYVAVSVDGDGINEGIVEGFDKAGPDVEKAGDKQGQQYGDHFSEGFLGRLRERLRNRGEDGALGFGGKAGSSEGAAIGERLSKSLLEKIDALGPETSARVRKLMADSERAAQTAERSLSNLESYKGRSQNRFDQLTNSATLAERAAGRLERELRSVLKAEGLLSTVSGNRGGRKGDPGFGLTSLDDWLRNSRSRNNFLNVLYKSLGFLIHGFEMGFGVISKFTEGMKAAGDEANLFQKISAGFTGGGAEGAGLFGSIGKGMSSVIASGPGAVAAILAIAAGASVLVSVLGALVAIVTALAAAVATALVGALAVGGAGILAMVGAGTLLVAAFTSMTDAQSKFFKTNAWLPLKAEFTGIGQVLLHDLLPATVTWSKNLQQALGLALPLAERMGPAFARAGNILTASFSGPGFVRFTQSLNAYLPSIVTNLSEALGHFLNGTLGMFAAIMPYVAQFAHWLEEVSDRFAHWANSAQGQNAIERWMERAVVSIQAVWNVLTSFTSFLFSVLFNPSAQNAGNTMFDSMANSFRKFADAIARAQADGSLNRWFKDGVKFGASLWQVVEALYKIFIALYNSGVLNAVGNLLGGLAKAMDLVARATAPLIDSFGKYLPAAMTGALGSIATIANAISQLGGMIDWLNTKSVSGNVYGPGKPDALGNLLGQGVGLTPKQVHSTLHPAAPTFHMPKVDLSALQASGMNALNNTSIKNGGLMPKPKWQNPWVKYANSLIKQGPSTSASIRNAMLSLNKSAANGVMSASKASGADAVTSSMDSLFESLTTGGEQVVNTAQQALNNAAQSLANATTKSAAKNALKKVKASQKDLKAALADQTKLNAVARMLSAQKVVTNANVDALSSGLAAQNATLADYAEARARVAQMLQDANQKLSAAVQLRDSYNQQVADSIRSFASLVSAQAQTLDGVQQALTAGDVTSNLQAKLDQIKHFQEDLRMLLAQGLSNDAYKQIVDAGVEQGTQFADALLSGGNTAIQNTNSLVDQINNIAGTLGTDTSNRLYQAGVDAAQGLVDGLTSLSAQLDSAAYQLGTSIANAVKAALGIHSPSRVLRNMMTYVGDGMALGLNDQTAKVGTAASALAAQVAVTPAVPGQSAAAAAAAVSGNAGPKVLWTGDIVTPTEDPHAVATEALNELAGRLT